MPHHLFIVTSNNLEHLQNKLLVISNLSLKVNEDTKKQTNKQKNPQPVVIAENKFDPANSFHKCETNSSLQKLHHVRD